MDNAKNVCIGVVPERRHGRGWRNASVPEIGQVEDQMELAGCSGTPFGVIMAQCRSVIGLLPRLPGR